MIPAHESVADPVGSDLGGGDVHPVARGHRRRPGPRYFRLRPTVRPSNVDGACSARFFKLAPGRAKVAALRSGARSARAISPGPVNGRTAQARWTLKSWSKMF